jgi:hypothetical protein
MSERITINLTEPKEEITFTLTDQKEEVVFSFSEAARGPQGEPGESASVTNAAVNAAIEDDPSATRDSLDLGTAALADTGTGASNVILGNDARLTDARTPTSHASSHVTGGTDKIRDASASQDGLMTTTFAAKLDGIEAGADVTDSTNVNAAGAVMESDYSPAHSILVQQSGTGSPSSLSIGNNTLVGRLSGGGSDIDDLSASQVRTLLNVEDGADVTDAANVASTINGATAKTTLVDADETVLTDSAASFALKKVTWLNVYNYILTKLQAAASIVFTGQLRSTNQTAATSDALMTRDLVATLFRNCNQYIAWQSFPTVLNATGTGGRNSGTTTAANSLVYTTGTTAGSVSGGNSGGSATGHGGALRDGNSDTTTNFTLRHAMYLRFFARDFTNGTGWIYYGGTFQSSPAANPTTPCFGVKLDGTGLKLITHNGTTFNESASLLTMTSRVFYEVIVVSDGAGNVSLLRNGAVVGSITGGPTASFVTPTVYPTVIHSITNNASTTNCQMAVFTCAIMVGDIY